VNVDVKIAGGESYKQQHPAPVFNITEKLSVMLAMQQQHYHHLPQYQSKAKSIDTFDQVKKSSQHLSSSLSSLTTNSPKSHCHCTRREGHKTSM
jgi:hypothetical protein